MYDTIFGRRHSQCSRGVSRATPTGRYGVVIILCGRNLYFPLINPVLNTYIVI